MQSTLASGAAATAAARWRLPWARVPTGGQGLAQSGSIENRRRRHRRRWVTSANGREAGVWVVAETNRSADPLHPHRGDRRRGPLRAAPTCRTPGYENLRARLRPRRLGARVGDAGAGAGSRRGGGSRRAGRRAGLSRRLVAVDDGAAGGGALAAGAGQLGDRLPELPPDRQRGDPRDTRRAS